MATTKPAIKSKTVKAGWFATALSFGSLLNLLLENWDKIQGWVLGIVPPPFDQIVAPAMAILLFLIHWSTGKKILDGRNEAAHTGTQVKGLFKSKR